MIHIGEIKTSRSEICETELRRKVYDTLDKLEINYERVDTDEVITMDDCIAVNDKLHMDMVKTLFVCNRQQTEFYLFITKGDKPFRSKEFSSALGISRVSFAPVEKMEEKLGTKVGAATVYSALLESAADVHIVFDRDVAASEWYGCSDGVTTGYMKIRTADILDKVIPESGHRVQIISV